MNREEASRILHPDTRDVEFEKDVTHWGERLDKACVMGAEALRSPWVKTTDRLPTHEDAYLNVYEKVIARGEDGGVVMANYANVRDFPHIYIWWMPIPPLPDVTE